MNVEALDIRRCRIDEIDEVARFIDEHWKKGHVLAVDRRVMDWQYRASDDSYNIIVARQGEHLWGILGYVPTSRYDASLGDRSIVWLALWKVRDGCSISGLGLRMLQVLSQCEPHSGMAVNGINASHPPMYKALRYQVAELKQYFVTLPQRQAPLIVRPEGRRLPVPIGGGAVWTAMSEATLLDFAAPAAWDGTRIKTPSYFVHRFLRHPFYRYQVHALQGPGGASALMASRVAEHGDQRVLRIVDFAGDAEVIAHMGAGLSQLMDELSVGHADFWQHGLPDDVFTRAGFECAQSDASIIVPNFFEPFHASAGRILCAFKGPGCERMRVFRADGDQDRPNLSLALGVWT